MKIVYRDTDLKTHVVELKNAVDVQINGIKITDSKKPNEIKVHSNEFISVEPHASNSVIIKKRS